MTAGQLKQLLQDVPDGLDVLIRCQWEGDEPNGNCFDLSSVTVDAGCTETEMCVLDCDQEEDL